MKYEPQYERFDVVGPQGERCEATFLRAGFLTAGDQPELYFFSVAGQEVVVGISGNALRAFQRSRRYLSREEKIDLAGLWLKQRMEVGAALESQNLFLRDEELARVAGELGIPA